MLKILILICPMALDHAACNQDTALDIVRAMRVSTPQQCGFMGQSMLAPTALVPDPTKQYVKVMCVSGPRHPSNRAVNGAIVAILTE